MGGCAENYCASGFATTSYNGTYVATGSQYGGKQLYRKPAGMYAWYSVGTGYWVLSNNAGDPQNQWKSSSDIPQACPDGAWSSEDGTFTAGVC